MERLDISGLNGLSVIGEWQDALDKYKLLI